MCVVKNKFECKPKTLKDGWTPIPPLIPMEAFKGTAAAAKEQGKAQHEKPQKKSGAVALHRQKKAAAAQKQKDDAEKGEGGSSSFKEVFPGLGVESSL